MRHSDRSRLQQELLRFVRAKIVEERQQLCSGAHYLKMLQTICDTPDRAKYSDFEFLPGTPLCLIEPTPKTAHKSAWICTAVDRSTIESLLALIDSVDKLLALTVDRLLAFCRTAEAVIHPETIRSLIGLLWAACCANKRFVMIVPAGTGAVRPIWFEVERRYADHARCKRQVPLVLANHVFADGDYYIAYSGAHPVKHAYTDRLQKKAPLRLFVWTANKKSRVDAAETIHRLRAGQVTDFDTCQWRSAAFHYTLDQLLLHREHEVRLVVICNSSHDSDRIANVNDESFVSRFGAGLLFLLLNVACWAHTV